MSQIGVGQIEVIEVAGRNSTNSTYHRDYSTATSMLMFKQKSVNLHNLNILQSKRGEETGVGKINWKDHLTNEGNESSSENIEVSNSSSSS